MNKILENLIERVAVLPKEAQEEIVRSVLEIEQRHTGLYELDDEERVDLQQALEDVKRGDVADDDEAAALFKRLQGMMDISPFSNVIPAQAGTQVTSPRGCVSDPH